MSMAILKSPTMIHQRLNLGEDRSKALTQEAQRDDLRASIEAQVRAELEAQLQAKLDAVRDEAKAEGYKEGLAAGHEDGMASAVDAFKKKQALLESVLSKAEEQIESWMATVSAQATDMAKEALCLFMGEQALNPTVLQQIIKRVSAGLRHADVLAVRLHPAECLVLRNAIKQQSASAQSQGMSLLERLVEDATLQAGGVVIDTPRGEYRATFDVQLKKLLAILDEQRSDTQPSTPVYHAIRA